MLFQLALKNMLPKTLFGRSLLIIVMPLIILQLVSTWIFYDRHWDTITRRLSSAIAGDIAVTLQLMQQSSGAEAREAILDMARQNMRLDISVQDGAIIPATGNSGNAQLDFFLGQALAGLQRPFRIDSSDFKERVVVYLQLKDGAMTVVVPGKRLFSTTTYIFIMWMVGTSLVVFAVASIFMRNQVRPIRRLATAADSFGKGRDAAVADFKPEGAMEVRRAAAAFNLMKTRLRRQMRQRTDMLSGVSHDLRTPITRMKLQLAMLPESPEVCELKGDIAEMERMIDGYLTFARGEDNEDGTETDLGLLVEDAVSGWRRNGAVIDMHVEGTLTAWLRPDSIRRALNNLIANAQRYGSHIWVRAGRRGDAVEITVDDDGPGIPGTHREEVFRPFYRLEESRNPSTGGTGLGLAIARDLVRGHGGDILLEDSPHGGLRARLRLPV